jgi:hypothetical protein
MLKSVTLRREKVQRYVRVIDSENMYVESLIN